MRFGVLGPLAVWTEDGEPVAIPGRKVRALLAGLLVDPGRPVPVDRLVDDLWGDATPANPAGALQVRVSQLRRALAQAEPGGRELVASRPPGYLLRVEPDAVDAGRFTTLTEQARTTEDPRARAAVLSEALALWRGPAFADFADHEFTRAAITRLDEQRLAVLEQQAEARLDLGEHSLLAGELGDLVDQHPYRERLRAAHMRALYRAGRQGEALDSYQDLRRRLADELGLDPGPELATLHKAILEQDPALTPAPAPAAPVAARPTTNLPAPMTELVGRDQAVAEVGARLATGRLVTLTGSGGVGKTRLAIAVAATLVDRFADGAWLVELAGLARPGEPEAAPDLAEPVMAALDVRDPPGSDEPVPARERLAGALRGRDVLLVLDNCEHLVEQVAGLVESLLPAAPGLRVLATSREPLRLVGEVVWDVPPLAVPDRAAGADPAVLARSSAVQLFAARAAAADRRFTLDPDTGPAVAELCRRLDGIPLALELAATRVPALGVPGLVSRLDDRFPLLSAGPRDAPARQRTLTAVIDWSWQLLTGPERVVLRRLAVHSDGCTLEAAEAVCAGGEVPAGGVVDLLARLVDRSLVVTGGPGAGGPRYRLLESVSAYCLDRLREAGEHAQVRQWHADYYLRLAERAEPHLYGHAQLDWLRRLDAEAANLRAALETTLDQGAEPALRLTGALAWYWFLRGRLVEACRALGTALAAPGQAPPAVRAKAEAWYAGLTVLRGDTDGWAERHRAALERYEQASDPAGRARAEWFLSFALIDRGDLAATERLVHRSLATFRAIGDRWGEAAALSIRAKLAHIRGDPDRVGRDARRCAELFGELGDAWGALQATDWLIGQAEMTGDYERATRLCRDGLAIAERLGRWPDVAGQLAWLAWITLELGDYPRAHDYAEQALRLATEQDYQSGEVLPKICLAFAARRDGKLDLAEDRLLELVELGRRQKSPAGPVLYLPMVLIELGWLAEQRGRVAAAIAYHLEAFDIAQAQQALRDQAWALSGMAGAVSRDGRPALAARLLGAAAATQRETGLPFARSDRADYDRVGAAVRAALGTDDFEAAFAAGEQLPAAVAPSLVEDRTPG